MGKAGSVRKSYSTSQTDYQLLEEVGHGASATVYRAIYVPSKEIVAVKRLDFDRCNGNLDDIRKESLTLSMIDHPNVISAYCSFVVEHYLWVVMPFMAEGSCLHLMKIAHPDGFEEPVIGSILKETLKALEYLHKDGHIHRDVKAGNILVDSSGAVKLGDFGVSAWMFDNGDRRRSRNTFVGTPCWMAPEVLQPGGGYNSKADIWSFGITALELAHGHAPFSKYPPMKVLLMTLQNAPPGLDYERDKRFSKSFKEMVAMCLVKDQTKRPTAEKLLKHSFFKRSKPPEFSMRNIFNDLPPLWDRVKTIENKDAEQLALKRMPSSEQEALSQSEYQRGVSAWNFDIEDLKAQASAMHDDEDLPETKEGEESMKGVVPDKDLSSSRSNTGKSVVLDDTSSRGNNSIREESELRCLMTKDETVGRILVHSSNHELMDGSENHKLQNDLAPSVSKQDRESSHLKIRLGKKQTYSGPLVSNGAQNNLMMEQGRTSERVEGDNQQAAEKHKRDARKVANFSGPLMLSTRASANSLSAPTRSSGGYGDSMEDKAKPNVVQIKGRFSVTSENVDLVKDIPLCTISQKLSQESPMKKSASVGNWLIHSKPMTSSESLEMNSTIPASVILPHLQNLSRLTSFQQDLIMNLLNSFQQNEIVDGGMISQARTLENDMLVESVTSERERLLLIEISESQARMSTLIDELAAEKLRHIQLQQEFSDLHFGEDMKTEETGDT